MYRVRTQKMNLRVIGIFKITLKQPAHYSCAISKRVLFWIYFWFFKTVIIYNPGFLWLEKVLTKYVVVVFTAKDHLFIFLTLSSNLALFESREIARSTF